MDIPEDRIAEFCKRCGIRRLLLFGSVLRDDFGPASDVDVLVRYEPGRFVGFGIFDMEEELSRLFGGRRVDIVNEKFLNRRLRDRILQEARVTYEQG